MNASPFNFTDNAAKKVYELITEEGNPNFKLRIEITGGGCSGLQYNFSFDERVDLENDTIIEKVIAKAGDENDRMGAVQLVVDVLSLQYLQGATIDYKKDLQGEQFTVKNPNAQTTCGCGSSFSV